MGATLKDVPLRDETPPNGIVTVAINRGNGNLCPDGTPGAMVEYMKSEDYDRIVSGGYGRPTSATRTTRSPTTSSERGMRQRGDRHEDARRARSRQRIAYEAARLMATQGVQDSREATGARRALGESGEQAWPTHEEVLRSCATTSACSSPTRSRRRCGSCARPRWRRWPSSRLRAAPVRRGARRQRRREAPVRLQVFAEDPEGFARFLQDQGWPASAFDLRVQLRRERTREFLAWRFSAGGVPFEIVALPPALLRQAPLGPDGRPMARASLAQLRAAGR
jgi:hypothetical protein